MQKSLLALFVFACSSLFSQTATVYGIIQDELGQPVKDAHIFIKSSGKGTFSDDEGNFSLDIPVDENVIIKITHVTYRTKALKYNVKPGERKKVNLKMVFRSLPAFIVAERQKTGMVDVIENIDVTKLSLTSGNFEDILKTGGLGTTSTSELSSGYNVRGGNFEENLIYVNDIEIYRPFLARAGQQEGLSFINSSMVESIHFSAGGFAAQYGDKLSSVLDVTYRKPFKFGGTATASLLGANLHLQGISENQLWTHSTGVRYRTNRYLLGALDTKGDYQPTFADLQTYITYTASEKWEHSFLGNIALNQYKVVPENRETSFGSINQALKFTVYFGGQEITEYQTFTGAYSGIYTPNDSTKLKFIASTFRTLQEEDFDVEGQYFLDELERDPGSDNFGNVAFNIGVGGFLRHARNELDATVYSLQHRGEKSFRKNKLMWGTRAQYDVINDKLKEWNLTDSAGFITPHPNDSVGYTDSASQPYQYLNFEELLIAKNQVSTMRFSGFVQNTFNLMKKAEIPFKQVKQIGDSTVSYDTVVETYKGFNITTGIRANYWTYNNQLVISPRAEINYNPTWLFIDKNGIIRRRNVKFRGAIGVYHQPAFYREYRDLNGVLNPNIKAQRSIHFVLGTDYIFEMWNRQFKLTSEVYHKIIDNVIPYDVDNVRIRYYAHNNAKAFAQGIDFKLNGKFIADLESWLTLSVMQTKIDIFDDVYYTYLNSDGDTIIPGFTFNNTPVDSIPYYPGYLPRPTDQRVSVGLFFQDKMPSEWNTKDTKWDTFKVNMSLIFATGFPYLKKNTLANPAYEEQRFIPRTPRYLRADIGFVKDFISEKYPAKEGFFKNFKELSLSLEVFNLLGIDNTVSYNFIKAANGRDYAIPNRLTSRRINLKLIATF